MRKILVSDYDQTFYLNDEDIEKNKKSVAIILQVCYKLSMRCALDPKGAYEKYKSFFV